MNSFRHVSGDIGGEDTASMASSSASSHSHKSVFGAAKLSTLESSACPGSNLRPLSTNRSNAEEDSEPVELEHMIGYSGTCRSSLARHPTAPDTFVYCVGNMVVLGSLNDPHEQTLLRAHSRSVSCLVLSPSGRYVASGQHNSPELPPSQLHLWSVETRSLLTSIGSLSATAHCLAFSPDERWLACASEDTRLRIWDLSTGDVISSISVRVSSLAFGVRFPGRSRRNPTYTLLATEAEDVVIYTFAYDVKTMQYAASSRRCDAPSRAGIRRHYTCSVFVDDDKTLLVCGSRVGDIAVFNVENGVFRTHFACCSGGVQSLSVLDSLVFVGGGDGTLSAFVGSDQHWNLHDRLQLDGAVTSLSASTNTHELLVGTDAGCMYRVLVASDVDSNDHRLQAVLLSRAPASEVVSVAFGQRSDHFATLVRTGRLSLWDLSDYSEIRSLDVGQEGVYVQFDVLDDDALLSGWVDGSLRCHQVSSGKLLWCITNSVRGRARSLAQHPKLFALAGDHSGSVRLWDRETRLMLSEYCPHAAPVTALHFDVSNPNLLHSCGSDRRRVVYDISRRVQVIGHQVRNGQFLALDQKCSGEYETITGLSDGRIIIYDTELQEPVSIIKSSIVEPVLSVSVSPSGRLLLAARSSGLISLYEIASSKQPEQQISVVRCLAQIQAHSSGVRCIRWTPDEKQIISAGDDASICVWNFYDNADF